MRAGQKSYALNRRSECQTGNAVTGPPQASSCHWHRSVDSVRNLVNLIKIVWSPRWETSNGSLDLSRNAIRTVAGDRPRFQGGARTAEPVGVTNGPYYEMKKNPQGRVLDADKLLRISYLIGIFKALNILHGQLLADEWVRLP